MQKIVPFLWFESKAEDVAEFYMSVFKDAKIIHTAYYGKEGQDITGQKPGTVMTIDLELQGMRFQLLNGGPVYKINPAISFVIYCKDQEEIDYYWSKLTEGGKEVQRGWLEDKFGVSWQVVPVEMNEMMADPDKSKTDRVMKAMFPMVKLDTQKLRDAYLGK